MTPIEVLGKVLGRPQEVFLAPREYTLRLGKWFGAKKLILVILYVRLSLAL